MKKWADVLLTTFSIQGPIRGRVFKLRTEGQQTFTEEKGGGKKDTEDIKMNMRCSERERPCIRGKTFGIPLVSEGMMSARMSHERRMFTDAPSLILESRLSCVTFKMVASVRGVHKLFKTF